jgi:D-sedoheptulose 7-phosphate isomerase
MHTEPGRPDITEYLAETEAAIAGLSPAEVEATVSAIFRAWADRKQVFVLGNGGSASTASHMGNDLSKATIVPGVPRMRVISITDNVALMTAWGNDESYDCIFKEQLENLLDAGDVVVAISASGNSPNVLRAVEFARARGAVTVGWTGRKGGKLKDAVDHCLHAPTDDIGIIESVHLVVDHLITRLLYRRIAAEAATRGASA